MIVIFIGGGEGGIRTHGPLRSHWFQDQLLKPLGHLSITVLLYQISLIISNNVIHKQAKESDLQPAFSFVFNIWYCPNLLDICHIF